MGLTWHGRAPALCSLGLHGGNYDRCPIGVACDRAIWVVWVRAVSRPSVRLVSCSDRTRSPLCSALLRF